MPWTEGTVSTFTNKFINTPETIGTGDGVDTTWSYTVSKPPIFISGVKLSYVIGAVTYTPTSDASGVFTGIGLTSGSVDEAGLITLVFSTAPDNLSLIRVIEYTTKGIAQHVKEFLCAGEQFEEVIGTGDDVETVFSYAPLGAYMAKGQIRLRVRILGTWYWIYDNGIGEFIHDLIVSSTIDYVTPSIDIEFLSPPEDTYDIEIVYTDSTTEGQDWLLFHDSLAKNNVGADAFAGLLLREYIFHNSGKTYVEDLSFGLRESQNIPTSQYLLELNLYENFNEAYSISGLWNYNGLYTGFDATTKHWTSHPSFACADLPMSFWIRATKDCFIINIEVAGSVYTSGMAGVGRRFCSKQAYPNPCFIIGNNVGNFTYTSISASHSMIADILSQPQMYYIKQDGGLADFKASVSQGAVLQPTHSWVNTGNMGMTTTNKVRLYELFFENTTPTKLLFEVPDLYHAPFADMTTLDTIDDGIDEYMVFQNIFRTTSFDFYAVKMTD